MICRKFAFNGLQDKDWIVKIQDLQIINGGQTCKTIHDTISTNLDIDFSQTYLLLRLYEVDETEERGIIQDITYATNSQNPVDFRDLKSNDEKQQLLEQGAADLGYVYKRKRDNQLNTNTIPATVAAEAVFAVWRECPHLAKYKRTEFFDQYYERIFENLNAAQMIMAVLIFRFTDNRRKQQSERQEIQAHRLYSQYFLAYMMGQQLLGACDIELTALTHNNFDEVKKYFQTNCETMYVKAENALACILKDYFQEENIWEINGHTMSAVFRRFDLLERYLKKKEWKKMYIMIENI